MKVRPEQNKPSLADVLDALKERDAMDALREGWEVSMATLPRSPLPFLVPEAIRDSRDMTDLDSGIEPLLFAMAKAIEGHPALRSLSWHLYSRMFTTTAGYLPGAKWPELTHALGDRAGMFYLLVGIALAPMLRGLHARMGVDIAVTRDTCKAVSGFCLNYMKGHGGQPGLSRHQASWLQHHARGKIFRLGRLEYYLTRLSQYSGGCVVYRHAQTDRVLALAREGACFDENGRACKDAADPRTTWVARLTATSDSITASPIRPDGLAQCAPRTLLLKEWTLELDSQSWVLSMHIPAGGGLSPHGFQESMRRAFTFFDRHFPDQLARAVVCGSWIYGEMLECILPASSNLVMNILETYRWATPSAPGPGSLWFIFCQPGGSFDPATAVATSSMERAVLAYVRGGGAWREGTMFFLRNDLDRFGSQCYRT